MERYALQGSMVLLFFVFVACGTSPESEAIGGTGGDGGTKSPVTVRVEPSSKVMRLGEELLFLAVAEDEEGTELQVPISWTSLDTDIAFVSAEGKVTALAKGKVGIRALAGDAVGTAFVTVEGKAASLHLRDPSTLGPLGIGDSTSLEVVVQDEDGDELTLSRISWTYSVPGVVSVDEDGELHAESWGETEITASIDDLEETVHVRTVLRFSEISAGRSHSCGLTRVGEAYCWGEAGEGLLGYEAKEGMSFLPVEKVGEGERFSRLAVGGKFTCGLGVGGQAFCWGENDEGQLGRSGPASSHEPLLVEGVPTFVDLAAGVLHGCGLDEEGTAHCWGEGAGPAPIAADSPFVQLAAGEGFTCGLDETSKVHCWGRNDRGQLGTEPFSEEEGIVAVSGIPGMTAIRAGDDHACGISKDRLVFCWGGNERGQLGNGRQEAWGPPQKILSEQAFTDLALGKESTCGVSAVGTYCWGANESRQTGSTSEEPIVMKPAAVGPGPWTFVKVTTGGSHACSVSDFGEAFCWGSNASGQLGSPVCIGEQEPCSAGLPELVFGQR